jgi:hypothetical protein
MIRKIASKFQMFTQVVDYLTRNVDKFPGNSGVTTLLKTLESAVETLSEELAAWGSARTAIRTSRVARDEAGENLRKDISRAVRLGRILQMDLPEIPANFTNARLLETGKALASIVGSMKKGFVEHGLGARFDEEFAAALEEFRTATLNHRDAQARYSAAGQSWTKAMGEASGVLARVDFLVANVFEDDPATLEAYAVVRAIQSTGGKKAAAASPPAAQPPASTVPAA